MDLKIVGDHVEFKNISPWLATLVNPPARALFLHSSLELFLSYFIDSVPSYLPELLRDLTTEGQTKSISKRR